MEPQYCRHTAAPHEPDHDRERVANLAANTPKASRSRLAFISSDNQARLAYRETEDNLYQLLFGQFKVDMGILRYDAIPVDKYDVAIAWIERKAAELLPSDLTMVAPRQETLL